MTSKRERDPICDVCGHCHVQGVKCQICGHVGKYIVPGGPNRPNRGAIPPVPPGPIGCPNTMRTPPTIDGLRVADFQHALQSFFEVLPQAHAAGQTLPSELSNLDQLKVVLETLPDYHPEDEQPSYVLAVECRSVVCKLAMLMPSLDAWQHVNWQALEQVDGMAAVGGPAAALTHSTCLMCTPAS
mmetsp:Transcript_3233/g.6769  ORF Transcript_3233/g.6769 Transcript_3233/m.6769 type:complete len:185 (-) Transcript_3233:47-601(-)